MLRVSPAAVSASLARLANGGRAAAEERLRSFPERNPSLPCPGCAGRGCYAEDAAGSRRPFDQRNFSAERGDRYVASCPNCRGAGRVAASPAEVERRLRAARREARRAYAALRARFCAERGYEPADFDGLARRRLPAGDLSPAAWLRAALAAAADFGVSAPGAP